MTMPEKVKSLSMRKEKSKPFGRHSETVTFFEYRASVTADDFALNVEGTEELSGRVFEILDGDGTVLFSGELPEMEERLSFPFPTATMDGARHKVFGLATNMDWDGNATKT